MTNRYVGDSRILRGKSDISMKTYFFIDQILTNYYIKLLHKTKNIYYYKINYYIKQNKKFTLKKNIEML